MNIDLHARVRRADAAAIAEGASILKRGGLIAFPTETVYGLGADATNDRAVAGIFAAKRRPQFNPLIVHVRDLAQAEALATFNSAAAALAKAFWPGALTLVLRRRPDCPVSLLASAGLDTVALRAPSHRVARALIERSHAPIAAPSANRSGRITATTAEHVAEGLGDAVDLILDDGPAPIGVESTVIGFDAGRPAMLRPGAIARERIEAVTGPLVARSESALRSPGQLASHYAPRALLRLNALSAAPGEALLGFGPSPEGATMNLSAAGDLAEAAANLFAMLRQLDMRFERIAVAPIPNHGLGEAINDRLERAAAPREAPA